MDGILANIARREHQVMHLEVANEAWQNGFPGVQGVADLRAFAQYLADRTTVLVAITSNDDTTDQGIISLHSGSAADLATVHFSRDTRTAEGGWLPVRDSYRAGKLTGVPPVISNEPIGPGSSVSSESDPIKLCSAAVFAYLANLPSYVFHSRAGIYGYEKCCPPAGDRLRFEDAAGIEAFRHIRQLLPPDLASWMRNNGIEPSAPFTAFCNNKPNRYWPDVSSPTDGSVGNIGGSKGNEFVCLPMGILPGGVKLEARRDLRFEVFNPLTGASITNMTLNAGKAFTLAQGPGAYIVKGVMEPLQDPIYYPPPESDGGWRTLDDPQDIRRLAGVDPAKLNALKEWLLQSDDRSFAAVVIRRGYVVLEVERVNSAKTDSRRVASVSKAICATVLAIASEQSQHGLTPRKMTFDDPAFDFIPWAQPLSDPRKARITVKQLFNHTSGICPEATGAPNTGAWEYILGHTGDERTAKLAFDPGSGCGYSTHALAHAALICETVTGMPYDHFAIQSLFKPLGIEHWWFEYYEGGEKYGRHPSHGLGMPARDLARIAYCMLRDGQWKDRQVIPKWFAGQTAAPTHDVKTPEMRWKLNPQVFSHGWELPARHWDETGRSGKGIPDDAREKPGSGGQFMAFVPSLDLVVTRQTGGSGEWQFEEYLRRACATVLNPGQSDTGL
jgi:CubicO group peptidase (beta-lactamase class C family)